MNKEDIVKANLSLLNAAPVRQPKTYQFADGEYRIPHHYTCTVCGKKNAVTPQVLINRVNKNYGGSLKKYLENAVCSHCKKELKDRMEFERLSKKYPGSKIEVNESTDIATIE